MSDPAFATPERSPVPFKAMLALSGISFLLIGGTIGFTMLSFNDLRVICVCISNWLAWSWICFFVSGLVGFVGLTLSRFMTDRPGRNLAISGLFIFQTALFFLGLGLLVYFGALLTRVI